jgi:hypothetical protein
MDTTLKERLDKIVDSKLENKTINTKSLWESDICKQTDEDRKKNPEKYIAMDMKISSMLDHIMAHSNMDEKRDADIILTSLKSNTIKMEELKGRQLGILSRVYGYEWRNMLV